MKKFLDEFSLATVQTIVGWILIIIAYANGSVDILEAFAALGINQVSAAAVGEVRNRAGKGVVRTRSAAAKTGPRA